VKTLLVAWLALSLIACVRRSPVESSVPVREWTAVLAGAHAANQEGRYADADEILVQFSNRNPRSEEAMEASYWRAAYKLDPANSAASRSSATRLLESYLAGGARRRHTSEAMILRRLASSLDSLDARAILADSAATEQKNAATRRDSREEELQKEVQSLKEQLEKTNEELTRIKRRLGSTNP
jgi:hypothetical protein